MNETSGDIGTPNFSITPPINLTGNINQTNVTNGTIEEIRSLTISYTLGGLLLLSIIICLVILVTIGRGKTGGFFQWKVFDRFTVYTVLCDLIYYVSFVILTAFWTFTGGAPEGIICTMLGIAVTQSAMCQSILTTITAIFVFYLVVRNRNLPIGKNDWTLYTTVFGVPLVILIVAALFDQEQDNLKYCDFRQRSGFSAWHYGLVPLVLIGSFLLIVVLYLTMFFHIVWRIRRITTVLENSSVNTTRLALKLSMFVVVHFIQFVLTAMQALLDDRSTTLYRAIIISSVLGGILNGVVYFTVRKR